MEQQLTSPYRPLLVSLLLGSVFFVLLRFGQAHPLERHLYGLAAAGALGGIVGRFARSSLCRQRVGNILFGQLESVTAFKAPDLDHGFLSASDAQQDGEQWTLVGADVWCKIGRTRTLRDVV